MAKASRGNLGNRIPPFEVSWKMLDHAGIITAMVYSYVLENMKERERAKLIFKTL